MRSITAKAIAMPAEKDLSFPPEDEAYAARLMTATDSEVRAIPGVWGHFAGGGLNDTDMRFIDRALKELLEN